MNQLSPQKIIKNINTWRKLISSDSEFLFDTNDNDSSEKLINIQNSCNHNVYVHLSTIYRDDGLCDPDYYSEYRCF